MNEIDVLVELMDKAQVELFLKLFKENYKNSYMDLKKLKLKKCIKKDNSKKDSFYNVLSTYKTDKFKSLTLKEILRDDLDVSDDVKFANAVIYHGEKIKEVLPQITDNLKNSNPPFYKISDPVSEKEIYEYFVNRYFLKRDNYVEVLKNSVEEVFREEKEIIEKVEEETSKLSIQELYSYFKSNEAQYGDIPILSVILEKLNFKDEDKKGIYLGIIKERIEKLSNIKIDNAENNSLKESILKYESKVEFLEKEIINLNEQLEKLKINNNKLEENNELLNKDNELFRETIKIKEIDINNIEKDLRDEINVLKSQNMSLKTKCDMYSKELMIFSCSDEEFESEIVIITNNSVNLLKNMFPEVKFYSIMQWNTVDVSKRNISKVIIHRNGMSSKDIDELEKDFIRFDIAYETILSRDQRELLDFILELRKGDWGVTYERV